MPRTNAGPKQKTRMQSKEAKKTVVPEVQAPEQKSNEQKTERQTNETGRSMVDRQLEQLENINNIPDSAKGDPKLYVDVNIGKQGGMERIIVFEGDTAQNLAQEFCLKHGLN